MNKEKISRVGETNIANNGQMMKIIEYINYHDISVEFEDGTVVHHKSYKSFKKGEIANPNFNKNERYKHVGETNIAKNGQVMKIIEYINSNDISVEFEDGTVVHHKSYQHFKTGQISNPNLNKNKRYKHVGETKIANNGQMMKIVEYINSKDISVEFEDGTVVRHKSYKNFKRGQISNPNFNRNEGKHVGETNMANNGQMMKIVKYINSNDISVEFEDGTVVHHKSYWSFKMGQISNPNFSITNHSLPEITLLYYLKKIGFDSYPISKMKSVFCDWNSGELDLFSKDLMIGIEYDGLFFHKNRVKKDLAKNKECCKLGIDLIRVRETGLPSLSNKSLEIYVSGKNPDLQTVLTKICKYINTKYNTSYILDIDLKRDRKDINNFYKSFRKNERNKHVGETNMAKNGQMMKIVKYINSKDISVEFEDGTVVHHKRYRYFKMGQISNPNLNKNERKRVGETNMANNGQMMKIVKYINSNDISVEFEDGTVVHHKRYKNFKMGQISNPNFSKKKVDFKIAA